MSAFSIHAAVEDACPGLLPHRPSLPPTLDDLVLADPTRRALVTSFDLRQAIRLQQHQTLHVGFAQDGR